MRKEFGIKVSDGYDLLIDGFVSRFEPNKEIERAIRNAAERYEIGLLTNAYPGMLKAIKSRGILPNVEWDAIVDSSVVGFRKPDREIYEIAQKVSGCRKGEEILFIDNNQKNIDSAKEFGWMTLFYDSSNYKKSSKKLENFLMGK